MRRIARPFGVARSRTQSIRRLPKYALAAGALEYPEQPGVDYARPRTAADCDGHGGPGDPCPFVSCRHHLYLDVHAENGSIKINWPDKEPHELKWSCSLAVAADGDRTLDDVGALMNLTRERVRQIQNDALVQLKQAMPHAKGLVDHE